MAFRCDLGEATDKDLRELAVEILGTHMIDEEAFAAIKEAFNMAQLVELYYVLETHCSEEI